MSIKNKKLLLAIILLVIIVLIFLISINYKRPKKTVSLDNAILNYFKDSQYTETSIWSLVENGYYNNLVNKCQIIVYNPDTEQFAYKEKDCDKAKSLSKIPVIKIETTNNLVLNVWNDKEGVVSYKLVNGGNSYYNETNITSSTLKNLTTGEVINNFKQLDCSYNIFNNDYELEIVFKNGEYKYNNNFSIKIDALPPVHLKSIFDKDTLLSQYADINDFQVLYFVGEKNEYPGITEFKKDFKKNFVCEKAYYAWSVAVDKLNNFSEVIYMGSYIHQC